MSGAHPEPPRLHELEALVMDQVWNQETATVRDVMTALNAGQTKTRAYTTVMTIMDRLHHKGLLDRRPGPGTSYVYTPEMSRDQYADARAEADVDAVLRDWGDVAMVHFAKQMEALDPKRREQLRRLAGGA
jgi:predicted transcriptional regulator